MDERPAEFTAFINSSRDFDSCVVLETKEEVEKFALKLVRWFFAIVPPSCVEGKEHTDMFPYSRIHRIPVEEGTDDDKDAWEKICHSGGNGPFLLGLGMWIWKRDGGEQFRSTAWDYQLVLDDMHWIIREGIRVGRNYFFSDT